MFSFRNCNAPPKSTVHTARKYWSGCAVFAPESNYAFSGISPGKWLARSALECMEQVCTDRKVWSVLLQGADREEIDRLFAVQSIKPHKADFPPGGKFPQGVRAVGVFPETETFRDEI
jgi:hypothetical protein